MDSDFLIVGGGLAGSVIASRLASACPDASIVVLEAGQDESATPLCESPLSVFGLHHTHVDWAYTTTPQRELNDRKLYLGAGKALGGSTAINYGLWSRGAKNDYDAWDKFLDGADAWTYNAMSKYFKKTETFFDTTKSDAHGFEGPIRTQSITSSSPKRVYGLRNAIRAALTQMGLRESDDSNAGMPLGFSERVENWREGKRQLAHHAYQLESFKNITVLTGQLVKKLIISTLQDGSKVAVGAETIHGGIYRVRREVIVSCGAIRSPQLLLLSGIGPREELLRHDITQNVDAPVGRQFHDHLSLNQFWKLSQPERGLSMGTPLWKDEPAFQLGLPSDWMVWTPGASAENLVSAQAADEAEGAASTKSPKQLQCARDVTSQEDRARIEFFVSYSPAGSRFQGHGLTPNGTHITSCVLHVLPTSRGTISLNSTDPMEMPRINPNYYTSMADRVTFRAGIRQAMTCVTTMRNDDGSFAVLAEDPPPGVAPLTLQSSDEEIDERVRLCSQTLFHYGGGCGLGSVVDAECKVMGIRGLRVADASIMPAPISAHYQVAVYAIGEKAAEMIAEDYEKSQLN